TDYEDNGRPPKSKKLVACCTWSWGPANSRTEWYFVAGSRSRREWSLWSRPGDPELGTAWFNPAFIRFDRPVLARDAAKALLRAAWAAEWKAYESPGRGVIALQEGALTQEDLTSLAIEAFQEQ